MNHSSKTASVQTQSGRDGAVRGRGLNTNQAFGDSQEGVAISIGSGIAIMVLRSLYLSEIRRNCLQM